MVNFMKLILFWCFFIYIYIQLQIRIRQKFRILTVRLRIHNTAFENFLLLYNKIYSDHC
jgi:hypothetical protein